MPVPPPRPPDASLPDASPGDASSARAASLGARLPDLVDVGGAPRPAWQKALLLLAAFVLITMAIVIWLLPIVGGSWFFWIPGLLLLGMGSRRAARWLNHCDRRLPHRCRLWLRPREVRQNHRLTCGECRGESGVASPGPASSGPDAPGPDAPGADAHGAGSHGAGSQY